MFSDPSNKNRRQFRPIILSGHKSTGKTTFVTSASRHAPDDMVPRPHDPIQCPDVVLLSLDRDGEDGAVSFGLVPRVVHFDACVGWSEQKSRLVDAVAHVKPLVERGEVSCVGLDLGAIDASVQAWITGQDSNALRNPDPANKPKGAEPNWQKVTAEGLWLYHFMSQLPCTVVIMTHLKARDYNAFSNLKNTTAQEEKTKAKKAIADATTSMSGLPTLQMNDISKGLFKPWAHATSFQLVAAAENVTGGDPLNPRIERAYHVICDGDDVNDAGTRFRHLLPKTWTKSLNALLRTCYGSNYLGVAA